ncbi:MAG: Hsp20/alpha crystallin family protein [Nannocystaceae bacterium]
MSLVPWRKQSAVAPMSSFQQEMNRLFDQFFDWPNLPATGAWAPAVSVTDSPTAYTLKAELPGMNTEDVEIHVANNVVTIKGERKEEKKEQHEQVLRHEFVHGAFMRQIALPTDVDSDHAEATMDKGMLTLKLPKLASAKARVIKPK